MDSLLFVADVIVAALFHIFITHYGCKSDFVPLFALRALTRTCQSDGNIDSGLSFRSRYGALVLMRDEGRI